MNFFCGKEGVHQEGKALNLPVDLCSNPNQWILEVTYESFLFPEVIL